MALFYILKPKSEGKDWKPRGKYSTFIYTHRTCYKIQQSIESVWEDVFSWKAGFTFCGPQVNGQWQCSAGYLGTAVADCEAGVS